MLASVLLLSGATTFDRESLLNLGPGDPPRLVMDESVGSDLAALAQDTWILFLDRLEARTGCFGDVRLRASRTLEDRATYDVGTASVSVRVPGTKALLQSALIHEWAHHVEFQCKEQQGLRATFLVAQGLSPGAAWRPDLVPTDIPAGLWAEIPSEQFAEAMVAFVLGSRQMPTAAIVRSEAVRVVAEWATGAKP